MRSHTSAYVSIRQHTSGAPESPSQDSNNARLDAAKGKLAAAQQRVAAACCSCVLQLRVAAACYSCVLQPSRRSSASSTTARLPAGPHIAYMCLTRKHAHSIHIAYYMRLARRHTYLCPHTPICVLILLSVSSYSYLCPHTPICVLIVLCLCPHTTTQQQNYRLT
jgi:hypothetical protein